MREENTSREWWWSSKRISMMIEFVQSILEECRLYWWNRVLHDAWWEIVIPARERERKKRRNWGVKFVHTISSESKCARETFRDERRNVSSDIWLNTHTYRLVVQLISTPPNIDGMTNFRSNRHWHMVLKVVRKRLILFFPQNPTVWFIWLFEERCFSYAHLRSDRHS